MTHGRVEPELDDYLERLRVAARDLPAESQRALSARTWRRLAEMLDPEMLGPEMGGPEVGGAAVRAALATLEPPERLAADERARLGLTGRGYGTRERMTVCLLIGSPLLPAVGPIAGMVLLWTARGWSKRIRALASGLALLGAAAALPLTATGLALVIAALLGLLAVGPAAAGAYLFVVSRPARRELARAERAAGGPRRSPAAGRARQTQPKRPET